MYSREKLAIEFVPIALNPDLPIAGGDAHAQSDLPIRYLHFHGCLELGLCHSGQGIFVVGDKVLPYTAGDVSFIVGTEVHLARSAPGTTSYWSWVYLDPILMAAWEKGQVAMDVSGLAGSEFLNILGGDRHPRIAAVMQQLVAELRQRPADHATMVRLLSCQLILEVKRVRASTFNQGSGHHPNYHRLAPALSRMALAGGDSPSIRELSELCGLSEAHFRRLFKATLGRSPRAYSFDIRMRLAASLLRGTNQPILSISQETGFNSLSSFSRVFGATYGMAPREWRNQARQ